MSRCIGRVARSALALAIVCACHAGTRTACATPAPQSGPIVELRYRYEGVDDGSFERRADANTLRLRLGYRWLFAPGWQLLADGDHVEALFGEHYNSTANGRTQYPVVADPQSSEFHQVFIDYAGDAAGATLGRQRVVLDNQRFFGNSAWRQNEQTFDALALRYAFADNGPTARYLYLDRVLRVNGHDNPNPLLREWNLSGHALNVSQPVPAGVVTGYAYLVENRDIATLSTQTFGVRWTGAHAAGPVSLGWALEYARQSDWSNNPLAQEADYKLIEPSVVWHGVTFKAGREILGGDGTYGFSTPYATLHLFNGWADRFLTTPANGLDDRYLGAGGKAGKASWVATWHDFHADRGGARYGSELDLSLAYPLTAHLTALLKYADYQADGFSADLRKIWASIEYVY